MVVFPHCKINLGLHLLSKREDGYHNIETCFYPILRCDVLEAIQSPSFKFAQSGIFVPGVFSDNLCVRAYEMLRKDFNLGPVLVHLHKVIPIGAGLGGGSSDGAFMLQLLNELYSLNLSIADLSRYAAKLGSDCSYFLYNRAMLGRGRGELLEEIEINLAGYWICITKPDVHISTAEAFNGISPSTPQSSIKDILDQPMESWKSLLVNDFEKTIFLKFPILEELKEKLYSCGAIYAAMSGSGSAVFGLFPSKPNLETYFSSLDYWEGELK